MRLYQYHSRRSSNIIFIIVFLFSGVCSFAKELYEFKGNIGIYGGYESNLYRNTHNMEYPPSLGGASYDPVIGDGVAGTEIKLRTALNINEIHRLLFSLGGDYQFYPRHANANQGQANAGIEYRFRPIGTIILKLPCSGGYIRKLGVDEGSDETTIYEYAALDAGPRFEFSPAKRMKIKAGYQFSLRDYRAIDSVTSLDNNQHEFSVAIEPHFGAKRNNTVGIECAYLLKKYTKLGSYSSTGTLYDSLLRTYHYATVELTYKHDFGPVQLIVGYRPRYRADAYEGYYTYFENRLSSGISAELKSETSINIDAAWKYRHYLVHSAAQQGTGDEPDLIMRYVDLSANAEHKLGKRISLFARYELTLRKTNTGIQYFHTYRDYTVHQINAGIKYAW